MPLLSYSALRSPGQLLALWSTNTPWFDVALTSAVFMVGQLCLGRFVEHQSRFRRLLKSGIGIALIVAISVWAGRLWLYLLLGVVLVGVGVVHGWWLPRRGINGWTAEPRDRYYALLGLDSSGKPLDSAG